MYRSRWSARLGWLLSSLLCAARLFAADAPAAANVSPKATDKFLRVSRNEQGEATSLDTAIVRFVPRDDARDATFDGVVVDLVGAVHVGEKSYYDALNKEFDNYDVVLYELVAPEGTRVPRGGARSAHPVAMLQGGMKNMLGLELQVEQIDYQQENLIHADMSPENFNKSMEERGDNFFALFFRMLGQSIAQQSKRQVQGQATGGRRASSDLEVIAALFDSRRSEKLKQIMAEQFEDMDAALGALEGPNGSTLITERNKVALEGLREQIAAGKKRIAIFYGAGHMNDMQRRLVDDFRLRRGDERWLVAWNLTPKKNAKRAALHEADQPDDAPIKEAIPR
jgi:hypothetical protein